MHNHLSAALSRSVDFLRMGHGWTQSDLSDRSGVARRTIIRIEGTPMKKNFRVSTRIVDQIADAAGISSGLLTLTPSVVAMVTSRPPLSMKRRRRRARSVEFESFSDRSRAYVVLAQGGDPDAFSLPLDHPTLDVE